MKAKWPFVLLTAVVCLAGGLVGALFGSAAAFGYGLGEGPGAWLGVILGLVSGLLAGGVWCIAIIPNLGLESTRGIVIRGSLWGMGVGLGSAVVVHAGLWVQQGYDAGLLAIGMICGMAAGLCVGFIASPLALAANWLAEVTGTDMTVNRTDEYHAHSQRGNFGDD